jgi:sugar-specific transcriptional regulator TrmB
LGFVLASIANGEKTLRELGLTLPQARVYLALVKLGTPSSVKAISTYSKVARQDVYRTLTELRELSLVEMIIGNPASFKAVPLQQSATFLMERKNQKIRVLMAEATELFALLAQEKEAKTLQENHQFVLIPKREVIISRMKKAIEASKKSILVITPWRELPQWLFILHESWQQALDKGVEVKWITEKKVVPRLLSEITRTLFKNPNFKLRTESNTSKARFAIYDDKEVFITVLSATNAAAESPALWTNNPVLIYILKDYFEIKWQLISDDDINEVIA